MKKILISAIVCFMFVVSVLPVLAAPANFGGNGQAWSDTSSDLGWEEGSHYTNNNNPDVRFDWKHHRMAVPGMGGHHANENAAVQDHGDQTLVDPHDTY